MKTLLPLFAALLLSPVLQGQSKFPDVYPTLEVGGKVLTNAQVMAVMGDGLKVMHDSGVSVIKYDALPDGLRVKYETLIAEAMKKAEAERVAKESMSDLGKAVEKDKELRKDDEARFEKQQDMEASKMPVILTVVQVLENGSLCSVAVVTKTEGTAVYSLGRKISGEDGKLKKVTLPDMMFVTGLDSNVVDGSTRKGYISGLGKYKYTDVKGSERTVRRVVFQPAPGQ